MQEEKNFKHNIIIENRERTTVTGVIDVISFDEDDIVSETEMGVLIIKGENLHVNSLNLEKGELSVDGIIFSINYEEKGHVERGSLFGRIFR